ncbi:MAG: hypothetical protein ACFCVC_21165 [Acidimicrobiia bacterium]
MTMLQRAVMSMALAGGLAFGPLLSAGAQTEDRLLYLRGAAYPTSLLSPELPLSETITNLDRPRNDDPGLTLESGGVGRREFDDARYQDFLFRSGGATIIGTVTLSIWVAPAGLAGGPAADLTAMVADCNEFGFGCEELAAGSASIAWTDPIGFVPITVSIPLDSHTFPADRVLKLRLTTETSDDSALWVAYDALETPSSLAFESFTTPTTTTVTTTTTTPPPTSPATHPPGPVTPVPSETTTTSTVVPATTSTTVTTTTTTIPATTSTTEDDGARSAVPLDPLVFELSYGADPSQPRANPVVSAAALFGATRSSISQTWPWLLALVTLLGAALWRHNREETRP